MLATAGTRPTRAAHCSDTEQRSGMFLNSLPLSLCNSSTLLEIERDYLQKYFHEKNALFLHQWCSFDCCLWKSKTCRCTLLGAFRQHSALKAAREGKKEVRYSFLFLSRLRLFIHSPSPSGELSFGLGNSYRLYFWTLNIFFCSCLWFLQHLCWGRLMY